VRRETAGKGTLDEPDEEAGADDHVESVQAGHTEIKGEIKLAMEVDCPDRRRTPYPLPLFQGQFLKVVSRHGMRWMILHVEASAGDEMMVELLFVFDRFDAQKDSAETKRRRSRKN